MAKITTVIDIGSNSMRMVVFEKSSRFAFHLLNETKSRVKISEGCYENNGNLQPVPMQRAFDSLKSFLQISKSLKSRKILCVATSALRDAPNSKEFLNRVKNELKLNIKIINGEKEAYYGGTAAVNLLHQNEFVTIDIGGGSTEFCFIKEGKIQDSVSLNIGTVRMKELFFTKNDRKGAKEYILKEMDKLFIRNNEVPSTAVGIGGTIRALSKTIMNLTEYPLDVLHGFTYKYEKHQSLFKKIIEAEDTDTLKELSIKKDRFDTICEGTFIFDTILKELEIKRVITSGVGVREGVYLTDLLRTSNYRFPANFNPSVKSLLDRYELNSKQTAYFGNNAAKIFDVLKPMHNLDEKYKVFLIIASKLHSIGNTINFYKSNDNTFDFILNGLSYDFLHTSRVIVAHIIKFSKKTLPKQKDIAAYEELLPSLEDLQWLSFMISLNLSLNQDYSRTKYEYILNSNALIIKADEISYLVQSTLDKIELPSNLELKLL
ncbi:Ppx/GppA phosphatase family protein [Candidatus Marinarcus aquaticus]|uniref:Guanosine polyphosphate pyrophosphohydrolase n=1 Tax=Candidatus Marinarcus aquaticus TaxID=2044504 RepID=A0A4Q0XPJ6_9BACT|nr:Ppx/GppA phosphatase family protein [Candidatus Marinarcus aquaticus]RXJ55294.1 guanosine polyphosphate pyrophosphohydrolase [Candidatus Marinarcus aquaticus]